MVQKLRETFIREATKYQVFPLDASAAARMASPRPNITAGRDEFVGTNTRRRDEQAEERAMARASGAAGTVAVRASGAKGAAKAHASVSQSRLKAGLMRARWGVKASTTASVEADMIGSSMGR